MAKEKPESKAEADNLSKSPSDSAFSRFFREASFQEKKRVFMEVAQKANEEQRKVLDQAQQTAANRQPDFATDDKNLKKIRPALQKARSETSKEVYD